MRKGIFITFEGGEGAGKSSVITSVYNSLNLKGLSFITTREPGGSSLGEKIRQMLLEKDDKLTIGSTAELFLFLAARAQHLEEVILPALHEGKIVLCDRFNDSTIAYQGAARGLGVPYVTELCRLACRNLEPDITVLLDVPVAEGLRRTRAARKENAAEGEVDRIESEAANFHESVRQALLTRASNAPDRFIVIDASLPLEKVQQIAVEAVLSKVEQCLIT